MGNIHTSDKEIYDSPSVTIIRFNAITPILQLSERGHIEGVEEGEEHGWNQE